MQEHGSQNVGVGLVAAGIVLAVAGFCAQRVIDAGLRDAAREVCDLVEAHYYRAGEPRVVAWLDECRGLARKPVASKAGVAKRLNDSLARLQISHLLVYAPDENRRIWENEAADTGVRARMIDATLVVHAVLPESPAARAGVRVGDAILAIDGVQPGSAWDARSGPADFLLRRRRPDGAQPPLEIRVRVEAEELFENLAPELEEMEPGLARLRVASFLPQYFDRDDWLRFAREIPAFRRLILDLRGNAGGSFPAMLRAASLFFCAQEELGQLAQAARARVAKRGTSRVDPMMDDLDAEAQLRQLASADAVRLQAFAGYPCFRGEITALVDSGTSSTAEILAAALQERKRARVWGQPTAGQVVLARWFQLARMGGDYSVSIPIAGFRSARGRALEGDGLTPERSLYYDLDAALSGEDSWLADAASR